MGFSSMNKVLLDSDMGKSSKMERDSAVTGQSLQNEERKCSILELFFHNNYPRNYISISNNFS